MADKPNHVFLGPAGPEGLIRRPMDLGEVPAAGWFHYLPEVLKGALHEGSPDIARAAMGIDVRTWIAGQMFPEAYYAAWEAAPEDASDDVIIGLAAMRAVRSADALIEALADKPPPDAA